MLPLNLSDTAATSQDGSSLELIAAIACRRCYIQDASGRGLCPLYPPKVDNLPVFISEPFPYIYHNCLILSY